MTMNKNILGAVFGAMLLAGCADEVMKPRRYVPANDPGADGKSTVSEVSPDPAGPVGDSRVTAEERVAEDPVKPQTTAPASSGRRTAEFQPMTAKFDDNGISSGDSPAAAPGEYIVRPGDTLGKIAYRHHVRLAELMKANKLTDKDAKRLRVGQKLVIPGKNGRTNNTPAANNGKAARENRKSASSGKAAIQPGEYIVKAGDTPERIARRAQIRLKDLMAANKLTEDGARRLRIGQKLVIPGKNGKTAAPAQKKVADKKNAASQKNVNAAPAQKETESKSAAKPAEVRKEDASLLNEMQNTAADAPVPAQAETASSAAPADATRETPWIDVTEDISLADFAKKYNTTPEALRATNDGIGDVIKKGDTIFLPR